MRRDRSRHASWQELLASPAAGSHILQIYDNDDFVASGVAHFAAEGLRRGEAVVLTGTEAHLRAVRRELLAKDIDYQAAVARGQLSAHDVRRNAEALMRDGMPDVDAALAEGSLILRDFSEWYAEGETLRGAAVVDFWLAEEARALAEGYAGIRITGNVSFLTPETWSVFMEYEDRVQKAFSGRRIVTLCTYPLDGCGAANVLDVVHRHSCTLEHPDEGWQILTRIPA